MQLWLLILQEWCLLVCSCFVIMRLSYPHKGRGGALNGDTKNSCEGDHTSSLCVATPSPRQRGEALSGGGCGYTWASLSQTLPLSVFPLQGGGCGYTQATTPATRVDATVQNDHFTVVGFIVSQLLSECKAEVDLVLIQTSFLFLWKLCL